MKRKTTTYLHFAILISLQLFICGCNTKYPSWNSPGSIQALGNEEELWIFLQFEKMVAHPSGGILTYDVPTVYSQTHFQDVLVIYKNKTKPRYFRIQPKDGTAGPFFNLGYIFGIGKRLYLFKSGSMGHHRSLFIWENDYFKLLTVKEYDDFFSKNNIKTNMNLPQTASKLMDTSRKNGWSIYIRERNIDGECFTWQGTTYVFKLFKSDIDKLFSLQVFTQPQRKGFPLYFEYKRDYKVLTSEEFEKLPMPNYGHPKGFWER